jgi:hypothetical protein
MVIPSLDMEAPYGQYLIMVLGSATELDHISWKWLVLQCTRQAMKGKNYILWAKVLLMTWTSSNPAN